MVLLAEQTLCPGWGWSRLSPRTALDMGGCACARCEGQSRGPPRGRQALDRGPAVTRHLPKVTGEITGQLNHKKGSFK